MNRLTRKYLTWLHKRKFAKLGKRCVYPIHDLNVEGHVEQGDFGRFRNNPTFRTFGEGRIIFGTRSGTSWGCLLEAGELIEVADYSGIAEYTYITDMWRPFFGNGDAAGDLPYTTSPVRIGSGCFVGSGCFIGPGVTIGDGAVIAHHTVLLRSVGPYEIWAGNPARRIGHRTEGVPESKLAEFRRLVEEHGIQADRYIGRD